MHWCAKPPWRPSGPSATNAAFPRCWRVAGDKPVVRRRAVLALAPFTGPEVEAALQAALADHDWQVRQAAEDIAPQFSEGPNPPG